MHVFRCHVFFLRGLKGAHFHVFDRQFNVFPSGFTPHFSRYTLVQACRLGCVVGVLRWFLVLRRGLRLRLERAMGRLSRFGCTCLLGFLGFVLFAETFDFDEVMDLVCRHRVLDNVGRFFLADLFEAFDCAFH